MRAATSLLLSSVFLISACGGATTTVSGANFENVDAYNARLTSITRPFIDETNAASATALTSAPSQASASMSGTFSITSSTWTDIDAISGLIEMEADFAGGTVSGSMTNFIEVEGTILPQGRDIAGSVAYSGSVGVGSGLSDDISALGVGSLTTSDGTTYAVTTTMDGDLYERANSEIGAIGLIRATATSGTSTETGFGIYIVSE